MDDRRQQHVRGVDAVANAIDVDGIGVRNGAEIEHRQADDSMSSPAAVAAVSCPAGRRRHAQARRDSGPRTVHHHGERAGGGADPRSRPAGRRGRDSRPHRKHLPGVRDQGSRDARGDPWRRVARLHPVVGPRDSRPRRLHGRGHVPTRLAQEPGHGRLSHRRIRHRLLRRRRRRLVRGGRRPAARHGEKHPEADVRGRLSQGSRGLDSGRLEHLTASGGCVRAGVTASHAGCRRARVADAGARGRLARVLCR